MIHAGESAYPCLQYNATRDQLSCLNDVKARLYLPVTIFLALLIIVGTLGNITVCVVYWRRSSRVSSHYFILSLAVLDLVTCVIGMPTEIADLVLPYNFESPVACQVLRFLHSSTIIASSTILIEVAFDRYFRICQLGRQFTTNKARLLCVGALILGIIFSWPSCILFGRKTVEINLGGQILRGSDCSTADSMRGTIYPTIYYLFLFSLFGLTLTFFTVLYAKIGLRIMGQNKLRAGSANSSCHSTTASRKSLFKQNSEKATETSNSELSSEHEENVGDRFPSSVSSGSSTTPLPRPKLDSSSSANDDPFEGEAPPKGAIFAISSNKLTPPLHNPFKGHGASVHLPTRSLNPSFLHPSSANANVNAAAGTGAGNGNEEHPSKRYSSSGGSCVTEASKGKQTHACYIENCSMFLAQQRKHNTIDNSSACSGNQGDEANHYLQNCGVIGVGGGNTGSYLPHVTSTSPAHYGSHAHNPHRPKKFKPRSRHAGYARPCSRQLRVGKTTTVLFAVTLAYILSFLPYLTVMVMRSVVKGLEESLSPMGELAYKLCVKSFFINNAINPIIYSFLNQAFRKDAADAFRKLFRRWRGVLVGNFA